MTEANPFNTGEKTPSLTFTNHDANGVSTPKPIGTRLGGKIVKAPEVVQQTKMGSTAKLYWGPDSKKTENAVGPNGQPNNPAMTIVTHLETAEGVRALWAPKSSKEGSLCRAIADAIKAAGASTAQVGGELWITLTGLTPNPQGGQPSKTYTAVYTPPNQFATEVPAAPATGAASLPAPPAPPAPPVPPAPAASAVPAPPAPPAPPVAEPRTPEGFTLDQLVAAGWDRAQAIAAYPMLGGVPAAPAVPAPPAPPVDGKLAALAKMSDEDLAMLGMNRDGTPVG